MSTPWNKFLEDIRDAQTNLGNPDPVWYRGQNKASYKLIASLCRNENWISKEEKLFTEFVALGGREYIKHVSVSTEELDEEWSTLFDMQHYDVPTRLLDWTTTLGIAVKFALLKRKGENEPAAVYVLDPVALNRRVNPRHDGKIIEITKNGKYKYQDLYWRGDPTGPVAIAPPRQYRNDHMVAQRSVFTVHGLDRGAIEEMFPDVVRKVLLPIEAMEGANEFLDYAGIRTVDIFPDAAGVAEYIRVTHLQS